MGRARLAAFAAALTACLSVNDAFAQDEQRTAATRIRADVEFLADDILKGRLTGTHEYEIAARYVAAQFRAIGLDAPVPAYLQGVAIRQSRLDESSARVTLHLPDGDVELTAADDFLIAGRTASAEASVTGELVFVGFGTTAPALGYDDYAGVDVAGKIAIVMSGSPGTVLKDNANSEQWAHFTSEKAEAAVAAGAIGYLGLHNEQAEAIFPWRKRVQHRDIASVRWMNAEGSPHRAFPELKGSGYLSKAAAARLFAHAPVRYADIEARLAEGEITAGFDLDASATLSYTSAHEDVVSSNVLGVLRGSDPQLADEYVIVTAHLDHIGETEHDGKLEVNNGAIDNAMGVALMLETARALAASDARPRRSVLFAALTAEEAGLIGADFLAHHPPMPIDQIVANVNLDGPMVLYPFSSVIAFGAERSTLGPAVRRAAESRGVRLEPDPIPEQGIFTRSDHYMFVRQGVPSVFLVPGFDSSDPELGGRDGFLGYLSGAYHSPQDDTNLPILWPDAARLAAINLEIIREVANADERPTWLPGDFFGETFAAD